MATGLYHDTPRGRTFFGFSRAILGSSDSEMSHKKDSVVFKQSSGDAVTDDPPGSEPTDRFPSRASPRNAVYVNFFGPPAGRSALAEVLREARRGGGISFSRTGATGTNTGHEKVGAATAPRRASPCCRRHLRCPSSLVRRPAVGRWAGDRTSPARARGTGPREPGKNRSRPASGPTAFRRALRVPRVRLDTPLPPRAALPTLQRAKSTRGGAGGSR
jgi:hypothetical protein